jgi:hypothetical protein
MVVLNQWESLCMHENQDVSAFMSTVYRILRELKDIGHAQSETGGNELKTSTSNQ